MYDRFGGSMKMNAQIEALNEVGQSVWYDNLSRAVLRNGELKSLVDQGVSGLTSNPTIFKKAIADSSDYDSDMQALSKSGKSSEEICETLMIGDVGEAADLLRPVFDKSGGADGYASIEVSPFLAQDTAGTVQAGKRMWERLNRPNIMIKVPATEQGLPAITALLAEGINVNVTLIFSVPVYRQVAAAFLAGVKQRSSAGKPIKSLSSVASFFVSRVDAICEKSFDGLVKAGKAQESARAGFIGKVGIANSRLAYQAFRELFGSAEFKGYQAQGLRVQRPLWASTGTKNPAFSPVLYVEELAGRDTVNTMPPDTLKALLQRGTIQPRLERGVAEASALVASVNALGIPFNDLLGQLRNDGVKSFSDSYRELLESIEKKRTSLAGR